MNLYINFLSYLAVALLLLFVGVALFAISTPKLKEFQLIAKKNVTAAMSIGGKVMGLALVLGATLEYSVSLTDMVIWHLPSSCTP